MWLHLKGHDYERCLEQVKRQAIICEKLELKENVTLPCLRKENWQRIEKKRRILNISFMNIPKIHSNSN